MLTAALQQTVPMGWIRPEEIRWVARLSDRMSARAYAKRLGGKPAAEALREYQQTMTEVGFLHNRAVNQTPPRDINERMGALLQHAAAVRPYVILPPPPRRCTGRHHPWALPRPRARTASPNGRPPSSLRSAAPAGGPMWRCWSSWPGRSSVAGRRSPPAPRCVTTDHGRPRLLGLGVVVLTPWKTVVARRAPGLAVASLALAAVIIICLVAGFVEVFAGYGLVAGLSPIQVHVGAAFVAVPLLAWHLVRHRRGQVLRRADLGRRQLLRTAGFVAGIGAAYAALEGVGRLAGLASVRRIASGPTGSRPPPSRPPSGCWTRRRHCRPTTGVRVDGVAVPVVDLVAQAVPVQARLDCTSGWFADAEWSAVALSSLLPAARLAEASSILVTSVTGYRRRFPVADVDALWLATGFEGGPLTRGTGPRSVWWPLAAAVSGG